jgi:hypothetical protein
MEKNRHTGSFLSREKRIMNNECVHILYVGGVTKKRPGENQLRQKGATEQSHEGETDGGGGDEVGDREGHEHKQEHEKYSGNGHGYGIDMVISLTRPWTQQRRTRTGTRI